MRAKSIIKSPLLLCTLAIVMLVSFVSVHRIQEDTQTLNSAGINEQLNFQARLLTGTGAVVGRFL